MKNPHFETS